MFDDLGTYLLLSSTLFAVGLFGVLLRRNSVTGAIEALARAGVGVTLNEALHA